MSKFSRIVIVGVGLMGGSLGLAVKRHGLADVVLGVDRDPNNLAVAFSRGLIDATAETVEEAVKTGIGNELYVVATPVSRIGEIVRRTTRAAKNSGDRRILITDLGSTKETVCSEINSEAFSRNCRYIGSHPITGGERSGPEHANADLYRNSLTVLTPTEAAREIDLAVLIRFWRSLESRVLCMEPSEHDRILARTSHLPHLISVLLARGLAPEDVPFIGPGFRSTTRLAGGEANLWRDIVSSNREAILAAIRTHETGLRELRQNLENRDWDRVTSLLETARRNRNEIE